MGTTTKIFSNPRHAYTRTLLSCVPQLTSKWGARPIERGSTSDTETTGTLQLVDDDHYVAM
jgi:ABC-type oligopeptide transport system ATPase subunit